eukprot:CAMPEP_0119352702 /NCGR_PEP_ID=MMETSP1334-20130426/1960_1 /TAXON_ID=127549 /ORGANISM="Calcidiscus leptoporus, Strain RCC1130" /LENGTH=111 /DNA_ID=CAMNT_0007365805 /DNA_START=299 /DNA_END=634 /DNA_ORIENTATION=+
MYSSSAVLQLLVKVAAQEECWRSSDEFATPAKIRLQQHLRTRKLKCEMVEPIARESAATLLSDAAQKTAAAPAAPKPKPKVREPKPFSYIEGKPVFGPRGKAGKVDFQAGK